MYEDELNLRHYIRLFARRWVWFVAAALLAGIVAFGLGMLRPAVYEANAAAAVVRTRTDISLDSRIETLEDYQLGGGRLIEDRMAALIALADSNEVMTSVLGDVGAQLAPEARTLGAVRGMSDVELMGDMIAFSVRHEDPELAAVVANSLTRAYVEHVNRVYGASEDNVENISAQVEVARQRYDRAQEELQAYLADERMSTLSLTLERELNIKRALLDSYQLSQVAIETSDASASSELLTTLYTELKQLDTWLADAETLRDQVRGNADTFASRLGDTLALLMLRSRVYGGESLQLQLDLANTDLDNIGTADVDNLITALETRREVTGERIQVLSETLGSDEPGAVVLDEQPLLQRIEALTSEIIDLESRLESELATREADRRELEATRDRAWEAYQALTSQLVEAEIQAESSNTEVRVADEALAPEAPVGSGLLTNTALAAIVGVMLVAGVVVFVDWWSAEEVVALPEWEGTEVRASGVAGPDEALPGQPQAGGQPGD